MNKSFFLATFVATCMLFTCATSNSFAQLGKLKEKIKGGGKDKTEKPLAPDRWYSEATNPKDLKITKEEGYDIQSRAVEQISLNIAKGLSEGTRIGHFAEEIVLRVGAKKYTKLKQT